MFNKIVKGLRNPDKIVPYVIEKTNRERSEYWCSRHEISANDYATQCNAQLWEETQQYSSNLERQLHREHDGLNTSTFTEEAHVGGGAAFDLLYFVTRMTEPETVVETGVAAGWSTRAVLDALHENDFGRLYSNDLPYSDRPDKQDIPHIDRDEIGTLVDENRRDRWELFLGPDRDNLPNIVQSVDSIDLFHYDSDKSYDGREFGMDQVEPKLHEKSIVVMDDIEDNLFFRDFVTDRDVEYRVINSGRSKSIGIIKVI